MSVDRKRREDEEKKEDGLRYLIVNNSGREIFILVSIDLGKVFFTRM